MTDEVFIELCFFFFFSWCGTLPYFSSTYTLHKNYTKTTFFWGCLREKIFFISDLYLGGPGGGNFFSPIFAYKKSGNFCFVFGSSESVRAVMGSLCAEK